MEFLVVSRVLQGAAGAILVPGSLALLTANFSGEAQGRAYGVWAAATAATSILGPFIGGILLPPTSWGVGFLVKLPPVIRPGSGAPPPCPRRPHRPATRPLQS